MTAAFDFERNLTAYLRGDPRALSPAEVMRKLEVDAGGRLLTPGEGELEGLAGDWRPESIIVRRGGEVRIVAVISARRGAFGRLVDAIAIADLVPVVVTPLGSVMPDIMRRWRWIRSVEPSPYAGQAEEVFRPRA